MDAIEAVVDVRKAQERLRQKVADVLEGKSGISVTIVLRDVLQYIDMERTVGAYLTLATFRRSTPEADTLSESSTQAVARPRR